MADKSYDVDALQGVADEVIDMLRPKHLTFEDIRLVLKIIDENLEYEVLREKPVE